MMKKHLDTITAIQERRSVKLYDSNFVMPEEDIRQLLELSMLSPTSFNIQNWRFVVAKDRSLRESLKAVAWGQAQVTDASLLIILCADLKAAEKSPERYWRNAPEKVQQMLVPMIKPFYQNNPQLERDEALRSIGLAAQTLMLAAKGMGYDSCPMVGFDPVKVAELIHLPKDHLVGMMVAIGKALQPAYPRGGQLPMSEVVIENRFK